MKLWNKLIYQKPRNYYNLQFPSPPQPLLMIPLCPVISSASTMIFVNLSGSGIGWKHGVISNKPEVTKKHVVICASQLFIFGLKELGKGTQ